MNKLTTILFTFALTTNAAYAEDKEPVEKVIHEPLKMEFEKPSVDDFEPVSNAGSCKLVIAPVVDARPNKETLGQKGDKPLFSNGVEAWSNTGMASLKDYGFNVVGANNLDSSSFIVEPMMYRLYSWPVQGFRIYGAIAMDVRITAPNGKVLHKKYRGTGSTNNGWNGDGEYVQAMNDAFNILLQRVADDIQSFCEEKGRLALN